MWYMAHSDPRGVEMHRTAPFTTLIVIAIFAFGCSDRGSTRTDSGFLPGEDAGRDAYMPLTDGGPDTGPRDGGRTDAPMVDGMVPDAPIGACPDEDIGSATGDAVATGSTASSSDRLSGSCGSSGGADHAMSWTAPADGTYTFDTNGSSFDTVVHLHDATCAGSELDCDDDGGTGLQSQTRATLTSGQTIVIVVDGYSSTSSGTFTLNIYEGVPETEAGACMDMMDNDRDGAIDCADYDCSTETYCVESICNDSVDNDDDGDTDCDDYDCWDDAACIESSCSNTVDDDGDGYVDCDDYDCYDDAACIESICNDSVDNDGDGEIDCADYDCDAETYCHETNCTDSVDNDGDGDTDCADYDCDGDAACVENCTNDTDDDGDGAIDCMDYDCGVADGCEETNCSNGLDDDQDGEVDCDDYDCSSASGCGEAVCTDGRDDDTDGNADCRDSECLCDAACIAAAPTCPSRNIMGMIGAGVATGSTAGRCSYRDSTECTGSFGDGPEYTVRFAAPSAGDYTFDTTGSRFDTTLYVLAGSCTGTELGCDDDGGPGLMSSLTLTLTMGQVVIIVIDGYSSDQGDFVLNITRP